jgi:hypothetical protein
MKIIIQTDNDDYPVIIPGCLIRTVLEAFTSLIVIQENTPEDGKQRIRSLRMLLKGGLLAGGDGLRKFFGIYGKPSKKDDVIDWYVANMVNKIVESVDDQDIMLKVETHNEDAIVTQIHTQPVERTSGEQGKGTSDSEASASLPC